MPNNGWYSVFEGERPESGEEILTLSYSGDFPAPVNMFDRAEDRVFCVCTYFYPGDADWNEVAGDPFLHIPTTEEEVVFDEEGFYMQDGVGPRNSSIWRRIYDLRDGAKGARGIICWKHLDYPTVQ